jgi:hypothetical protein
MATGIDTRLDSLLAVELDLAELDVVSEWTIIASVRGVS